MKNNIAQKLITIGIIGIVGGVGIIVLPGVMEKYEVGKKLLSYLSIGIGLIGLSFKREIKITNLTKVMTIFWLTNLILVLIGEYKFYGIQRVEWLAVLTLLLLLSTNVKKRGWDKIFLPFLISFSIISLVGIFQYFGVIPVNWETLHWEKGFGKRVFSTIGNPNALGGYLVIFLPLVVYFYLTKKRALFLPIVLVGFMSLLFTNSWSSWMGIIGGGVVYFVSFLKNKIQIPNKEKYTLIGGMSLILVLFIFFKGKKIIGEPTGRVARFLLWETAIKMIKEKPFIGFSPGGFFIYSNQYLGKIGTKKQYQILWEKNPNFILRNPGRPHNEYLNLTVEGGIVLLGVFFWFVVTLLKTVNHNIKGKNPLLSIALLSSIIGVLVQSITDFPLRWITPSLMFFVIIGMVEKKATLHKLKKWEKGVIVLVGLLLVLRGVFYLISNIYFTKATFLKEKKNFPPALNYYTKSLKFGLLSHLVYSYIAEIHYRLKNWDSAKNSYQKAMKIQPFHEVLCFHLGRVYLKLGDTSSSENMFKKAIKLEPRYGMVYSFLGSLYRRENKIEEALKTLKKGEEVLKKESSIYNELGIVYAQADNRKKAEENFIKAIILMPSSSTLWYNLWVLREGGTTFIDAIAYEWIETKLREKKFPQILEKYPNHPKSLFYQMKSSPLEVDSLVLLLQIAPVKHLCRKLVPILKKTKRWEESEEAFYRANESFEKKEFRSAEKWLRRVIQLNPTIGVAYYNLGILLTKMNSPMLAIEAYIRYISLMPEDKEVESVKEEINFLIKTYNIFD